jgi:tRNA A-37 threonylcarbamoyl transferase component Bud32
MITEQAYTLDNGEELHCLEVVRSLPGKRLVFLGEYAGEQVFVKLYLDPNRGEIHWRRELDGLKGFFAGDIATAKVLYAGKTADQSHPLIVLEQLQGMVSIRQAWDEADDQGRERILQRMILLLTRHHRAGLCQTDLHLGNFLLSGQEIFSLDGAGVKLYPDGMGQDDRLENLALFIAQLPPVWEEKVSDIYDIYTAGSGWQQGPGGDVLLAKVKTARERRWKEYRGKLFRNCTAFTYTKHNGGFQVVANRYANRELLELLSDPDASLPGQKLALKNGNTCTLWSVTAGEMGLVVKRYNVKGFWHGLKLKLLSGRGERSWLNGYRLGFYGVPTPAPVALLRRSSGMAYLFTEQIDGVSAREWFRVPDVSDVDKAAMADQIANMFSRLRQQRIVHGDLKATNILIAGGQAMLIDLDAMRRYRCPFGFKRAWNRDMQRFLANWQDDSGLLAMFRKSLQSSGIDVDHRP